MNTLVLSALAPVIGLIGLGYGLGRVRVLGPQAVRVLSNLTFMLLTPVVLFRAMSKVHVEQLDLKPAAAYILTLALVFWGSLLWRGVNRRAAVLALAATYGNSVMIGIPLISLLWGDAGLVTLFTLVPIHPLLLLTSATVVLEFALVREQAGASPDVAARMGRVALRALRKAFVHPVPLPIVAGLLFAQTGLVVPGWLEQAMAWAGQAFGPLALTLVGVSLAGASIGAQWRAALALVALKNLLVPLLAALFGWALGMSGLPLAVLIVTAALPVGANAFLFSQRYAVAEALITASVALSTTLAALSVTVVLLLLQTL